MKLLKHLDQLRVNKIVTSVRLPFAIFSSCIDASQFADTMIGGRCCVIDQESIALLKEFAKDPEPIVSQSCEVALSMLEYERSGKSFEVLVWINTKNLYRTYPM
jgi:hypothetical protein